MSFKIIVSKQFGADFRVVIDFDGGFYVGKNEIVTNIHDFAIMTFLLEKGYNHKTRESYYIIKTRVKKTELAKDLTIKVTCYKGTDIRDLTCLEEWSDWVTLPSALGNPFIIELNVTVSKASALQVRLHEDTNFTDFKLKADDGTVAVHRTVLAAHSDMFKTMLLGCWKETQEGQIELEGVTRETLQHFKDYMYLGTLPDVGFLPLLLLAIRYLVDTLKLEILFKISMTVTEDNLHDLLKFAIQHECHELLHNLVLKTPENVLVAAFNMKRPEYTDTD